MNIENRKILYIDDEQRNLDMFKIAFKRDYTIFTCTSANEGLEILDKHGEIPIIRKLFKSRIGFEDENPAFYSGCVF